MKNFFTTIKMKLTNKLLMFSKDSRGIGTIEMVLLIVIILGILIIFRDYVQALIATVFSKIDKQINKF